MRVVIFTGVKGGVGTSTMAAAFAAIERANGKSVGIYDYTGTGDVHQIHGLEDLEPRPGLDLLVVDGGVNRDENITPQELEAATRFPWTAMDFSKVLVVSNDFNALRAFQRGPSTADRFIFVMEEARPLELADMKGLTGVDEADFVVVERDPAIGRAADAGLLGSRLPQPIRKAFRAPAPTA